MIPCLQASALPSQLPQALLLLEAPAQTEGLVDQLLLASLLISGIWLLSSCLVHWQRRMTNRTPVGAAQVNRKANPGFLVVDNAAREKALAQGEAFTQQLDERDKQAASPSFEPARKASSLASLFLSLVSMGAMVIGSISQAQWLGSYAQDLTATGKLASIVRAQPIAAAVTLIVLVLHALRFISSRREA